MLYKIATFYGTATDSENIKCYLFTEKIGSLSKETIVKKDVIFLKNFAGVTSFDAHPWVND